MVRIRRERIEIMQVKGIDLDEQVLESFCLRYHVRRMSLFGSILRDDFGPDSDVDILVEFEPGHVPGLAFFRMEVELSGLLGRKVDLNTPGFLGKRMRESVLASAEVVFVAA